MSGASDSSYHLYGISNSDKLLFIVFVMVEKRGLKLVRPITAYEMSDRQRKMYKKRK